jgi:hypothetical protein
MRAGRAARGCLLSVIVGIAGLVASAPSALGANPRLTYEDGRAAEAEDQVPGTWAGSIAQLAVLGVMGVVGVAWVWDWAATRRRQR